jgi:ATP-dependent Lhr-like helicase
MASSSGDSVFGLLADPVRRALAELGFTEPTLPQTKALPAVLGGENVLLVAPTGSGKTEAVILPVLSRLVMQKERVLPGFVEGEDSVLAHKRVLG